MLPEPADSTVIIFAYDKERLFEHICQHSSYVARSLDTISPIDRYAFTADERDLFDTLLRVAIGKLYEIYVGQTNDIHEALFFDKEYESKMLCGFSITRQACNANRLIQLDLTNEQFIIENILLEWAKTNILKDQIAIYEAAVAVSLNTVVGHCFEVRIPSIGRCYTINKKDDADIH